MRPNTMNKFGAVLDDFGLETMLDKLMEDFIRPISRGNISLFIGGIGRNVYKLLSVCFDVKCF